MTKIDVLFLKFPIMKSSSKKLFTAVLEKDGNITMPFDVPNEYGTRGQVKVKASFDGHPYRGVLANMGTGCHIIGVRKDIQKAIGKKPGDLIQVEIEQDFEERGMEIPEKLKKVFTKNPEAKDFFDSLSYTNRKEYVVWISSAKKEETKEKRLREIILKLNARLKNPSAK